MTGSHRKDVTALQTGERQPGPTPIGLGLALVLAAALAAPALAQAPPRPDPDVKPEDVPGFAVGPFKLEPYVQIGSIGYDTNVYYNNEKIDDFTASGGPGLRITLPRRSFQLYGDGYLNYLWFAESEDQRRLQGRAGGGFSWRAGPVVLGAERFYMREFLRPSPEITDRVLQDTRDTRVFLTLGRPEARFKITPNLSVTERTLPEPQDYQGTDLNETLTQDTYRAGVELAYALTPKTSLLVPADYQVDRFDNDPSRDSDSNRFGIGLSVQSETAPLSMRAVGGIRLFRPKDPRYVDDQAPWVEASVTYRFGPKTRLTGTFHTDLDYSAFRSSEGAPTVSRVDYGLQLSRQITYRIDLQLWGRYDSRQSDAKLIVDPGSPEGASTDDQWWEAGADLGYAFFGKIRVGVLARYSERQSNYSDFGVDGLTVGFSIRYAGTRVTP
jgi:hypothetical protein